MTDHKELRRLAAAAAADDETFWARLVRAKELKHKIAPPATRAVSQFIAAANPQAVTALLDELEDSKRRHEVTERQAGCMAETLGGRLEKAVAERDQLIKQFLDCRLKNSDGSHRGWQISGDASINELARTLDPDHHKLPEITDAKRAEFKAHATPHTAATPTDRHKLTPEDIADMDRFAPVQFNGTADSVQVRTPGTIEVCELCKVPIAGFFNDGCWRTNHPTAPCPIRPKQGV